MFDIFLNVSNGFQTPEGEWQLSIKSIDEIVNKTPNAVDENQN